MDKLVLINLLVKLGVAAAVASALVRSRKFKELLYIDERTLTEKLWLTLFIATPLALGVLVRVSVPNFMAADLAFEGAILIGVMGGRITGILGAILMSLPALVQGGWLLMPLCVLAGFLAGVARDLAKDREAIWSFSPFIDLSVYRWLRRNLRTPHLDWQTSFFLMIVAFRFLYMQLARAYPRYLFSIDSQQWGVLLAIYATTIAVVAIPLKIFNNTRIERKLEIQERLLLQARMEALQSQINPHFLFNTLNSVSSLVRFDPDTARELIVKLANILRRLLKKTDAFVPLQEELDFIDDYLDIEVVRFGRDKLRVVKELEPASLDVVVPSMLLQPLIENCIKHGLAPKLEGGSIHLRSRVAEGALIVEVEDDGVGMGTAHFLEKPSGLGGTGIGMANVAERLKVLYGEAARMTIDSRDGQGTTVRLRLPLLQGDMVDDPTSIPSLLYETRSSTQR